MTANVLKFTFSNEAQSELSEWVKSLDLKTVKDPNFFYPVEKEKLKHLKIDVEKIRNLVEGEHKFLVTNKVQGLNILESRYTTWAIATLLGEPLVQNDLGHRVINIYDRDRTNTMAKGARYHQTREGGTIHTDNVNTPLVWDYLLFGCVSAGHVGGENILVNGLKVLETLKAKYPKALAILEKPFTWECRGVDDTTYESPIISYNEKNEPIFRHLRPYMESAHLKTNNPLTKEQLYALDTLDSLLESSDHQSRVKVNSGEVFVSLDYQSFHGRTCFSDALENITIIDLLNGVNGELKRTLDRLWIKKQ